MGREYKVCPPPKDEHGFETKGKLLLGLVEPGSFHQADVAYEELSIDGQFFRDWAAMRVSSGGLFRRSSSSKVCFHCHASHDTGGWRSLGSWNHYLNHKLSA